MKPARLIVLGVALFAGAIAFMLSGRETPPQVTVVQQPTLDTVEVLVAKSDIPLGTALKPDDLGWQTWPASAASSQFIRKNGRPGAVEEFKGAIARAPFVA